MGQIIDIVGEEIITFLCEASMTANYLRTTEETVAEIPQLIESVPKKEENDTHEYSNMLMERIDEMEKEIEHWLKRSQELEDQLNCIICFENRTNTVWPCTFRLTL